MTLLDLHTLPPGDLSLAERVALLPPDQRAELLDAYDEHQLQALSYDWEFWGRPDQLPPTEPWSIWAIVGSGRGSGKSRTGAEWIRRKVRELPPGREGVFIGATPADVRDLMVDGPSGIRRVTPPSEQPDYEPSKRLLTWPNGVIGHCRSGADPEGVRGLNLEFGWCIPGGELVETASGPRPIETIRTGEEVWTRSGLRTVTAAAPTRVVTELVRITLEDGRHLDLTPEHRVWSDNRWAQAQNVTPYSKIWAWKHRMAVRAVERRSCPPTQTYDLKVDGAAEFVAGGMLVHNCDEIVKWRYLDRAWHNLRLAMREGDRPQTVITTTPKRLPLLRTILDGKIPGTFVAPRASTYRNAANLAPSFLEEVRASYEGTRMGRQEIWGEYLELVEGALFSAEMIEHDRWKGQWSETEAGIFAPVLPDMRRVVVGVDPSGSVNTDCGIIASAVDAAGRGYVLADSSMKGSPGEWGKAVIRCAWDNDAEVIVGERDYGGDMVKHIIAQIPADDVYPAGSTFRYIDARARNIGSKRIRAETIVNLYEQHKVSHVGMLADLEDEMTSWVPDEPGPSPNRLDALVWSLWVLMIGRPHKPGRGAARQIIDARIGL